MQSLANCRNRRFVNSTKFLNTILKYGARNYTIFNVRSTNIVVNVKPNRLTNPTYKEIRRELSALHSLFKRHDIIKTHGLSRILGTRCYSSSSSNRDDPPDRKHSKGQGKPNDVEEMMMMMMKWVAVLSIVLVLLRILKGNEAKEEILVSWNEFEHQMLAKGEVKEIWIDPNIEVAVITLHHNAIINGARSPFSTFILDISSLEAFEEKLRKAEQRLGIKMGDGVPIVYKRRTEVIATALRILLTLGGLTILYVIFRKKNPFKFDISTRFTRANYTLVEPFTGKGVRFEDVAGLKEAKMEVMEFVDYLKNPKRYKTLGAKVPKGALLLGPPGCGKTLLAKAVATEANVYFFSMNGSEFIEMLGGLGAARVRSLFQEAKKMAPSIIYIDEIDAIGKKRSEKGVEFSNSESDRTLNQLLVEMDGVTTHEDVILLASTNRAEVLDRALLRPGRFDRHILIDLPTSDERKQIFENYLKTLSLDGSPSKYSGFMAYLTPGFSGADIANVCNEAALHAVRSKKKVISGDDLLYAIDRMIGGSKKKTNPLTPAVKKVVAYHEAGHIIVGWLLEHTDALLKVTIVPRTNLRLGFSQHIDSDVKLHTKEQLFQLMCMTLGGRVAEYLTFNEISTNAENDLKKVTKLAYDQVQQYGMSSTVGLISFDEETTSTKTKKAYSKKLGSIMDAEVRRIIGEAYKTAEDLLRQNKDKLTKVAEALFEKETLTYDDIEKLIGPPPHGKKRLVEHIDYEKGINQTESRTPEPSPA